jgi:hypothetical protein
MLSRIASQRVVPSTMMYELAVTSRQGWPQPMMKVQPTKPPYFLNLVEGQKIELVVKLCLLDFACVAESSSINESNIPSEYNIPPRWTPFHRTR